MKPAALFLSLALLVPTAEAKPRKIDWKLIAVGAVSIGSAIFQAKAAQDCRSRVGVVPCFGGYGPAKAIEGVNIGMTAGFLALSAWAKHQEFKEWPFPAVGMSTWNIISGVQQTQAKRKDND